MSERVCSNTNAELHACTHAFVHTYSLELPTVLSVSEMAMASGRPELVTGLHYFNPVQIMKLVEIVETPYVQPEVLTKMQTFVANTGKVGVMCKDTPGFIVNRLLVPNLAQAILFVERGDATVADVDLSMQVNKQIGRFLQSRAAVQMQLTAR